MSFTKYVEVVENFAILSFDFVATILVCPASEERPYE